MRLFVAVFPPEQERAHLEGGVAATYVLQWYVNNKLDESPMYAGQVGDIDISLLAGAYSIENVEIEKTEGEVPVPLFAAREVRFSVLWKGLMNGAIVGETEMFEPQINIVDSMDETKKQYLVDAVGDVPTDESVKKVVQLIVSMPEYQLC